MSNKNEQTVHYRLRTVIMHKLKKLGGSSSDNQDASKQLHAIADELATETITIAVQACESLEAELQQTRSLAESYLTQLNCIYGSGVLPDPRRQALESELNQLSNEGLSVLADCSYDMCVTGQAFDKDGFSPLAVGLRLHEAAWGVPPTDAGIREIAKTLGYKFHFMESLPGIFCTGVRHARQADVIELARELLKKRRSDQPGGDKPSSAAKAPSQKVVENHNPQHEQPAKRGVVVR